MTPPPPASGLTAGVLRALLSRDRAQSILGDVAEELARRHADGDPPRWPRIWSEMRALFYLLAELRAAAPTSARATAHIFRDSLRALRGAPATTAFILLVLTLGISAATVTFSVVDTVVLRPLPFPKSDELVVLGMGDGDGTTFSTHEFLAWGDRADITAGLAAYAGAWPQPLPPTDGVDAGGSVVTAEVSPNLFEVLQVAPVSGRWLRLDDVQAGRDAVAVIDERLAARLFGNADAAVGRALRTSAATLTVVGVMPATFSFPLDVDSPVQMWTPLDVTSARYASSGGGLSRYLRLVARLRPDTSPDQVRAALDAASGPLRERFPRQAPNWPPRLTPLYDSLVGDVRGWMLLVLGAVGLVMLVACANVANLLLARTTLRTRELAVRAAFGASRRQLIAGQLVESLMLALAAAALGVLVASWGLDVARAALPDGIPRAKTMAIDVRVLAAAITAAIVTGVLFAAVPAWQASRADVAAVLKDGGVTVAGGRRPWRSTFAIFEVAFVAMLLVATTLVVSSFINVTRADIGFDRDRLIATDFVRFTGPLEAALDEFRSIPGVTSAGAMAMGSPPLIMRGFKQGGSSSIDLYRPGGSATVNTQARRVSASYFDTAGMTLRRGAGFEDATGPAVVLDELAARRLFPDRDPIGATLRLGRPRAEATAADDLTVIGVVAPVHVDGPEAAAEPQVFLPLVQRDGSTAPTPSLNGGNVQFVVRTAGPAATIVPPVEAAIARLSPPRPGRPAPQAMVIEEAFRNITADRRFNAGLMTLFGTLALVIGVAGLYGVLSSIVAQQSREIGVRVALGATRGRIQRDVVREVVRYVAAGLAIGLPAAWLVSRAFTSLYYGVTPADLAVYLVVATVMTGAGVAAAIVPARRAAAADPIVVLRH